MLNGNHDAFWAAYAARQSPTLVRRWHGVAITLTGAFAAAAAALVAALFLLPSPLVFPVTGAGLVLAAGAMGLIAWASPPEVGTTRLVFWDTAGVLTLFGLCAAMLGEGEQAVALLERDR